jgi:hypothetical protein
MGMSASVDVWVGYKMGRLDEEEEDFQELLGKCPKLCLLVGSNGDFLYGQKMLNATGGLKIEEFFEAEDMVGFGCKVFWGFWGNVECIDLVEWSNKATLLKEKLEAFFSEHNIDLPIDTYISVDYS